MSWWSSVLFFTWCNYKVLRSCCSLLMTLNKLIYQGEIPPPEPFMPINLDCMPPPLLVHARSYSNINSAALLNTLYIPSILQPLSLAFHSKPPPHLPIPPSPSSPPLKPVWRPSYALMQSMQKSLVQAMQRSFKLWLGRRQALTVFRSFYSN